MSWQNQGGGGPWGGGGGGGQGPWGRGPSGGQRPPDIEELLRRSQDRVKRILPGGFGGGRTLALLVLVAVILWGLSGFYNVQPNEQGVELVFGRYVETTEPGLNFNWPAPVGHVETPPVTDLKRVEVGFRSSVDLSRSTAGRDMVEESLMLTGDENIIDIQFVVFWRIKDAEQYVFNVAEPDLTVKSAAEAAMREIIGQTPFERARTEGRAEIQARSLELIQQILDNYGSGILVTQVEMQKVDPPASVIEAFRDVQAARADQERSINEAQAYFNRITQQAEGAAQQIIREAEGYKEEKISIATGEAARFLSVYEEYKAQPDITKRRIYLETMSQLLRGMDKVLIDDAGTGSGAVPYLSLNELTERARSRATTPPPAPQPDTTTGATQ
jgi:membrane protease subunit HflK